MDSQKVSAILDWPALIDKMRVQRFVGVANFYRRFIKGFSATIAPYYTTDQTESPFPVDP